MLLRAWLSVGLLLIASVAMAEVVDSSEAGFTCRSVHQIAAAPNEVWQTMTADIGQWWSSDHTRSGDAGNLFMGTAAGEKFGEKLPGGGSVTHMEIVYADKGKLLRMRGSLGPLQSMALVGVLSVEFVATGDGTQLTVTYAVGGYAAGGLTAVAAPVAGVITEQFDSLQDYFAK